MHTDRGDDDQRHSDDQHREPLRAASPDRRDEKNDRDEHEAELEQHESDQRRQPALNASLAHATKRFDEKERAGYFRPDACDIEDDRRPEREEREERARRFVVDAFVLEQANGRPHEQHAEDCDRGKRAGETSDQIAGNQQDRQERLMPRILLAVLADGVAGVPKQIGASGCGARERCVLIAQIEIVIVDERLGDQKVERLVAVGRRSHLRRDDERVDDRGNDRGTRRRPLHLRAAREGDRERRELQDGNRREREVDVRQLDEVPEDEREDVAADFEREISLQRLSAERDERERDERDQAERDQDDQRHRSNASTCSSVFAGSRRSTLTWMTRAFAGIAKRTAPSTHASYPYARTSPAEWRGK